MDGLDDFLSSEQPVEAVEPAEQPETPTATEETPQPVESAEAKAERVRDEKGRFAPKGETEEAPPASEERASVPVTALQEERRKRQELEARLAQIEQAKAQTPPPSVWEDEQGYGQHIAQTATQQAVHAASLNARLDMSEMMVAQANPDFGDMKPKILEFMATNPGLREEILGDMHPWNKAYQLVKNHERMRELAAVDVNDLQAKLREQIRAELEAELKAKPTPTVPETLADAQSARGSSGATLNVPSLDEILARK